MSSDGIMDFDPIDDLSRFPWADDKEYDNYQKSENEANGFNEIQVFEEESF